jgi:hypothetical protein
VNTKKLFFWIGILLIVDGAGSIYFGSSCLNNCVNNNNFGNLVRIARIISGGLLVFYNK